MKISIVSVVWNDLDGLVKTYRSILSQSQNIFEWVIIDGGTSGFKDCVNKFVGEFAILYISEKDKGIYDAMNKGLYLSSGDYILFLNAGDEFESDNSINYVSNDMCANTNIDIFFYSANIVGSKGSYVKSPECPLKKIYKGVPANHQATFFRRAAIVHVGYNTIFRICGDYWLVAKLLSSGCSWRVSNIVISRFYLGGASTNNIVALAIEANYIQRDILSVGFFMRSIGFIEKIIKGLLVRFL